MLIFFRRSIAYCLLLYMSVLCENILSVVNFRLMSDRDFMIVGMERVKEYGGDGGDGDGGGSGGGVGYGGVGNRSSKGEVVVVIVN